MQVTIKLGKGWKELRQWTRAFEGRLEKALLQAMKKSLQLAKARIIENIEVGNFKKNSELVTFLKRVRGMNLTPLIGNKNSLIKALATSVDTPYKGRVGLRFNRLGSRGGKASNIGELLHEGGTIRITKKMRRSFARFIGALEKEFNFKLTHSPKGDSIIRIPARKFIQDVIESDSFQKDVDKIFTEEIRRGGRFN